MMNTPLSTMNVKRLIIPVKEVFNWLLILCFILSSLSIPQISQAQVDSTSSLLVLPQPGVMVHLSPNYKQASLSGIVIHPENPFKFDFLINRGDQFETKDHRPETKDKKKEEYEKLVKYFLASLTVPEKNQWVNLSPYEKNRIIKEDFGLTEMGRDLLAQDYILKQVTASLIYPKDELGKKFWERVYERAYKEYGRSDIPINTFNKVWIVPDHAAVYESGNTVYVLKNHLKVLLEADYLASQKASKSSPRLQAEELQQERSLVPTKNVRTRDDAHKIGSDVVRQIIIPELTREVNEGENFANLRQIYSGMILATWYKRSLKESILNKIYANKSKTHGVNQRDPKTNQAIYQEYLKAFKKGVFNYIKEDVDKYTQQPIPRKYFSGGMTSFEKIDLAMYSQRQRPPSDLLPDQAEIARLEMAQVILSDKAITAANPNRGPKTVQDVMKNPPQLMNIGDNKQDKAMKVLVRKLTTLGLGGMVLCSNGGCSTSRARDFITLQDSNQTSSHQVHLEGPKQLPVIDSVQALIDNDKNYPDGLYRIGSYKEGKPIVVVVHGFTDSPSRHKNYLNALEDKNLFVLKYDSWGMQLDDIADKFRKDLRSKLGDILKKTQTVYLAFSYGNHVIVRAIELEHADPMTKEDNIFKGSNWLRGASVLAGAKKAEAIKWEYLPEPFLQIVKLFTLDKVRIIRGFDPQGKRVQDFLENKGLVDSTLNVTQEIRMYGDSTAVDEAKVRLPGKEKKVNAFDIWMQGAEILPNNGGDGHTEILNGDDPEVLQRFRKAWEEMFQHEVKTEEVTSKDSAMSSDEAEKRFYLNKNGNKTYRAIIEGKVFIRLSDLLFKIWIEGGQIKFEKVIPEGVISRPETILINENEVYTLGRSRTNTIVEDESYVSRKHLDFKITKEHQGSYSIEINDLDSSHGTEVYQITNFSERIIEKNIELINSRAFSAVANNESNGNAGGWFAVNTFIDRFGAIQIFGNIQNVRRDIGDLDSKLKSGELMEITIGCQFARDISSAFKLKLLHLDPNISEESKYRIFEAIRQAPIRELKKRLTELDNAMNAESAFPEIKFDALTVRDLLIKGIISNMNNELAPFKLGLQGMLYGLYAKLYQTAFKNNLKDGFVNQAIDYIIKYYESIDIEGLLILEIEKQLDKDLPEHFSYYFGTSSTEDLKKIIINFIQYLAGYKSNKGEQVDDEGVVFQVLKETYEALQQYMSDYKKTRDQIKHNVVHELVMIEPTKAFMIDFNAGSTRTQSFWINNQWIEIGLDNKGNYIVYEGEERTAVLIDPSIEYKGFEIQKVSNIPGRISIQNRGAYPMYILREKGFITQNAVTMSSLSNIIKNPLRDFYLAPLEVSTLNFGKPNGRFQVGEKKYSVRFVGHKMILTDESTKQEIHILQKGEFSDYRGFIGFGIDVNYYNDSGAIKYRINIRNRSQKSIRIITLESMVGLDKSKDLDLIQSGFALSVQSNIEAVNFFESGSKNAKQLRMILKPYGFSDDDIKRVLTAIARDQFMTKKEFLLKSQEPDELAGIIIKMIENEDWIIKKAEEAKAWDESNKISIEGEVDQAMSVNKGGIDFDSSNLNLLIKKDKDGVVLPLANQDLTVFDGLQGFQPVILNIMPAGNLAILNELKKSV